VLADGTPLGRVRAVHQYGAGDSLEIARENGGTVLVPFTRAAVPAIDLAQGRLVIAPPEGLLDETPLPSGEGGPREAGG
jgi:16S rRNA processing protein RimM